MASLKMQILRAMDDSPTDHIVTVQAAEELADHIAKKLINDWSIEEKD